MHPKAIKPCTPDSARKPTFCARPSRSSDSSSLTAKGTSGKTPFSGFLPVILVLANLFLIPYHDKTDLDRYVFGLEELENNVHPALQRRLLLYLRKIAIEEDSIFFITTHSNVVIDLFSTDGCAQILHITNDGKESSITKAVTYVQHKDVLDDQKSSRHLLLLLFCLHTLQQLCQQSLPQHPYHG